MKYFLLLCVLVSCISCHKDTEDKGRSVIVYIDLSGSTTNGSRDAYVHEMQKILSNMLPGDRLYVSAITDKSIREKGEILSFTYPVFTATTKNALYKSAEKNAYDIHFQTLKDSLSASIQSRITDTSLHFPETDIFSALKAAENHFHTDSDKKILVLMSDMLECDAHFDFAKKLPAENTVQEVLDLQQKERSKPDLQNVEVYVCGADAANNDAYFAIHNFWSAYFTETGAQLQDAHYGPSLTQFEK